jgi:hypothetical protein
MRGAKIRSGERGRRLEKARKEATRGHAEREGTAGAQPNSEERESSWWAYPHYIMHHGINRRVFL